MRASRTASPLNSASAAPCWKGSACACARVVRAAETDTCEKKVSGRSPSVAAHAAHQQLEPRSMRGSRAVW